MEGGYIRVDSYVVTAREIPHFVRNDGFLFCLERREFFIWNEMGLCRAQ